jgi:hypothetical protein
VMRVGLGELVVLIYGFEEVKNSKFLFVRVGSR